MTELDLLLRALASPTRLRILALLRGDAAADPAQHGPWALARALRVAPATITFHLKVLLRMRLVSYHKKERYKTYRIASPHRGSIRWRLLERLRDELPADLGAVPPHPHAKPGRPPVRPGAHSNASKGPLATVWRALTSFSHFRRLLMLRLFDRLGPASMPQLMRAADLSQPWVEYHLDKLLRRGVIEQVSRHGKDAWYRLCAKPPTPLQDFMTGLLRRELAVRNP